MLCFCFCHEDAVHYNVLCCAGTGLQLTIQMNEIQQLNNRTPNIQLFRYPFPAHTVLPETLPHGLDDFISFVVLINIYDK